MRTFSPKTGNPHVRLVPDLSAASLRQKQTKELSLWYRLRYLSSRDFGGSGSLPLVEAISGLIDTFLISRSTAYRILALGEGNYWRKADNNGKVTLHLISLKNVALYLNTSLEFDRHFRDLSVEEFKGSIKQTRAQLYASVHKPRGIQSNPIARQSISEHTGLCKQQQRRYEKEAHVGRTPSFAVFHDVNTGQTTPQYIEVFSKSKTYLVQKRLGNSYHGLQEASGKGMQSKVHRLLRVQESLGSAGAASSLTKRIYGSFKGLLSISKRSTDDCYYLVNSNYRTIRGRLEWAVISTDS